MSFSVGFLGGVTRSKFVFIFRRSRYYMPRVVVFCVESNTWERESDAQARRAGMMAQRASGVGKRCSCVRMDDMSNI